MAGEGVDETGCADLGGPHNLERIRANDPGESPIDGAQPGCRRELCSDGWRQCRPFARRQSGLHFQACSTNRITSFLLKQIADLEASGALGTAWSTNSVPRSMALSALSPLARREQVKNGNKQESLFPFYFLVLRDALE